MKTSLRLTTKQQLAFTPQIQQTIRMLQLGAKQLSAEIDETLNANPLLREVASGYSASGNTTDLSNWLENQAEPESANLEGYLIGQLSYFHLDSESYVVACIIISCLEDDGYLKISQDELLAECKKRNIDIGRAKLDRALNIVRKLDPAGIAATDLASCLKEQLFRQPTTRYQQQALLLCDHLQALGTKPQSLTKRLGLDRSEFEQALKLIKRLNPAPASQFSRQPTVYIQPDILLDINEQSISISLNPAINRGIELNLDYVDLLKNSKLKKDHVYLHNNLKQARWWINALAQRNKTLLRVADYMIRFQLGYFSSGEIALKPLGQQDIADHLNLHVSTISRAIKDKYIQSSAGITPLASLLARKISTSKINSHSNQSVKALIRDLIKNEPSQTPLSDSKIVDMLKTKGITIARRTVNKYRDQLNIPPSSIRKLN